MECAVRKVKLQTFKTDCSMSLKAVNEALDMLLEIPREVPLEIPRVDMGGSPNSSNFPK
jgi:hypothetical protein